MSIRADFPRFLAPHTRLPTGIIAFSSTQAVHTAAVPRWLECAEEAVPWFPVGYAVTVPRQPLDLIASVGH